MAPRGWSDPITFPAKEPLAPLRSGVVARYSLLGALGLSALGGADIAIQNWVRAGHRGPTLTSLVFGIFIASVIVLVTCLGYFAARTTGYLADGVWAGALAAGLLGALMGIYNQAQGFPTSTPARPEESGVDIIIAVILVLFNACFFGGLAALISALGSLFGRSAYEGVGDD